MLRVTEKFVSPRKMMTAGQRVTKKYRLAQQKKLIKKREYKKLKAIVPSVSKKNKVPKIQVIEEAIKYIDELHVALAKRMHLLKGIPPAMLPFQMQVTPNMLAPGFPFPPNHLPAMLAAQSPLKPILQLSPPAHCNNERHR